MDRANNIKHAGSLTHMLHCSKAYLVIARGRGECRHLGRRRRDLRFTVLIRADLPDRRCPRRLSTKRQESPDPSWKKVPLDGGGTRIAVATSGPLGPSTVRPVVGWAGDHGRAYATD